MAHGKLGMVLVVVLAACGGGGDPDPAAVECNALVTRICDRATECAFAPFEDDCEGMIEDGLPQGGCDDADQVAATYTACMDNLLALSCEAMFPGGVSVAIPTECENVILFEP
jgi:hypothetical protein